MSGIDWRKHKTKIAEKTLDIMKKQYPDVTRQKIEETIELFHTSQAPRDECEKAIFHCLKVIELGLKVGWLK